MAYYGFVLAISYSRVLPSQLRRVEYSPGPQSLHELLGHPDRIGGPVAREEFAKQVKKRELCLLSCTNLIFRRLLLRTFLG